jgi:hypothetical protein
MVAPSTHSGSAIHVYVHHVHYIHPQATATGNRGLQQANGKPGLSAPSMGHTRRPAGKLVTEQAALLQQKWHTLRKQEPTGKL